MHELQVLNHMQAMASADAAKWQVEVDKEHDRMVKKNAWEVVSNANIPPKTMILKSVWFLKPKADGSKCSQLSAKSCSHAPGQHYDLYKISAWEKIPSALS